MNLQGGKEEKDPPGVNGPSRVRRASETKSLAPKFAFGGCGRGSGGRGCDSDLVMDLLVVWVVGGPHGH